MRKTKIICQKSTARMTKWNSSKNSKILWMKQLNGCLTSQQENTCRKDKPEPRMEQGKCKEVLRKEVEMLPQINISGDSDNERNSRISLETMDTDQCIQKLVRTNQEGSEHTQHKIEETIQYWVAQEKKAVMCWGTYAYMHICTKSIQIYFGIFFDFILVLLSFHCSHTIPNFFQNFPYFSCHFIHFKSLSFWHGTVNFCFRLSARVPARRAESNCIIHNVRIHLGELKQGAETGYMWVETPTRIFPPQCSDSHWGVSISKILQVFNSYCTYFDPIVATWWTIALHWNCIIQYPIKEYNNCTLKINHKK